MKTLTIGILLVVGFVSLAGCHWRHRRWRGYDRSDHSYSSGAHYARDVHMPQTERDA